MRHFSPTTIIRAPLVKYVHRMDGSVITSRKVALGNPWDGSWITNAIATDLECDPDDVECVETDDGEFFVVKGERVGFVDTN